MTEFQRPQLEDRQWVEPLLRAEGSLGCEYNFANLYLWSRAWSQELARVGERYLLLGAGTAGVSLLAELSGEEAAAWKPREAAEGRPGFKEAFLSAMKQRERR